jgi:hypothetical protein
MTVCRHVLLQKEPKSVCTKVINSAVWCGSWIISTSSRSVLGIGAERPYIDLGVFVLLGR